MWMAGGAGSTWEALEGRMYNVLPSKYNPISDAANY